MEKKLWNLHVSGVKLHIGEKLATFLVGVGIAVLMPLLHLGVFYHIWQPDKPTVDREKCTCDCFDTVFRGRYEWPPSSYKHFYFNATSSTLAIWLIVVIGIIAMYECVRYIVPYVYYSRQLLRTEMFALLISSLYPHYYGWWGLINYVNEDFYSQWKHQLFFTATELISTSMVVHLCCRDNRVLPWKLLVILNISLTHVIVNGLDQFITNVIYHEGQPFEVLRDLLLMAPDIFHLLVTYFELSAMAQQRKTNIFRLFVREELLGSLILIMFMSLLGKNL